MRTIERMAYTPLRLTPTPSPFGRPPPRRLARLFGWLAALALGVRALLIATPVLAAFVVVTALAAGVVEEESARWLIGAAVCLVVPLVLRWRLAKLLEKRTKLHAPAASWFLAALNAA